MQYPLVGISLVAVFALLVGLGLWFGQAPTYLPLVQLEGQEASSTPSGSSNSAPRTPVKTAALPSTPEALEASFDLEKLASDVKYADGYMPLGDNKYTTTGPKKGYVYLCNARKEPAGAFADGPWIVGNTWNYLSKLSVGGAISWSKASFSNTSSASMRTLKTNALPINHTTGSFPISSGVQAYAYDRNPNSIKSQSITVSVPMEPKYSQTPYCMGGEVGIMLSGVPLFNAFDAGLRDAAAHEVQDSCDGHPQVQGEYHYHSLSSCFKDISVKTVIGFAYDGYPITGPKVGADRYLYTEDLDECHGITSEILLEGKSVVTYHYVMTLDFPYSVSCFRAKPVTLAPSVRL